MSSRSCIGRFFDTDVASRGMMALELAFYWRRGGHCAGLRYTILILVPAILFAIISAITVGVVRADSFWSIGLMTVALVTAVQLGYLAGVVLRAAIRIIALPAERRHQFRFTNWVCLAAYLAVGHGEAGIYCAPSPASASASLVRQSLRLRRRASSDSDKSAAAMTNSTNAIGRVKKIVQ